MHYVCACWGVCLVTKTDLPRCILKFGKQPPLVLMLEALLKLVARCLALWKCLVHLQMADFRADRFYFILSSGTGSLTLLVLQFCMSVFCLFPPSKLPFEWHLTNILSVSHVAIHCRAFSLHLNTTFRKGRGKIL